MSLFKDMDGLPAKTKGLFIKGIIHFIDNDRSFEVLQEDFFFAHLEKNGEFLSQDDFNISTEYELGNEDWGDLNPKEGEVYGFLWQINLIHSKYWTDCGYEYDSEIETSNLEFNLFDEEATKRIFVDNLYQFTEEVINE